MPPNFDGSFVQHAVKQEAWDAGNEVLYKLCEDHPHHKDDKIIIAKIWLIGRTYAAAIERRREYLSYTGDSFYEEKVAPEIKQSPIDEWFLGLAEDKENNPELALEIHKNLTDLFQRISGLEKRSLASKYLHFHFRDRYFIYDDFSKTALTQIVGKQKSKMHISFSANKYDAEYAKFFLGCRSLNQQIKNLIGRELSPRELDKCLLAWNREVKSLKAKST